MVHENDACASSYVPIFQRVVVLVKDHIDTIEGLEMVDVKTTGGVPHVDPVCFEKSDPLVC